MRARDSLSLRRLGPYALAMTMLAALVFTLREVLPIGYDLYHYYHPVAKGWLAGETRLYDDASRGFYLPPWALFPLLPLAVLDLRTAMAIMAVSSLACILYVAFGYSRRPLVAGLAALCPYSLTTVLVGTFDAWALLGLYGAYRGVTSSWPWLLGGALVLATVRPQLCVITAPLILLAVRGWELRELAKAAALPLGVLTACFPLFGLDWPLRWWENLSAVPPLPYLVKSTYDATELAGIPIGVVIVAAAALIAFVVIAVRRSGLNPRTLDLAVTANAIVSPYMLSQSYVVLFALPWGRLATRLPVVAGLLYLVSLPMLFRAQGLWDRLGLLDVTFPMLLLAVLLLEGRLMERRSHLVDHPVPGNVPDPLVPGGP